MFRAGSSLLISKFIPFCWSTLTVTLTTVQMTWMQIFVYKIVLRKSTCHKNYNLIKTLYIEYCDVKENNNFTHNKQWFAFSRHCRYYWIKKMLKKYTVPSFNIYFNKSSDVIKRWTNPNIKKLNNIFNSLLSKLMCYLNKIITLTSYNIFCI